MKFIPQLKLRNGNVTEGDKIIGSQHRAKIVKNKIAPPFRKTEIDIMNEGGISKTGSLVDMATEYNIIQKAGSFYKYKGEVLAQGREATKIKLGEEEALYNEINDLVWKEIKGEKTEPNKDVKQETDNTK